MSMGNDDIRAHFDTILNGLSNEYKIVFDNQSMPVGATWLRGTYSPFPAYNAVLSQNKKRFTGIYAIQIFIDVDQGTGEAWRLADRLANLFENKQAKILDSTIFTYAAECVTVGDGVRRVDQIERGQYQLNVNIPWEAQ